MAEQQFFVGVHGALFEHGRLLVLRRAPAMSYEPASWDLPGGHLALGENFEQCLRREIAEETGLGVKISRLLGLTKAPPDPYIQALFACRPLWRGSRREIILRAAEHVEARWVTLEELERIGALIPYLKRALDSGMLGRLKV